MMNEVDYLCVNRFRSMSHEAQRQIMALGPHRPWDIQIIKPRGDSKYSRYFNTELFNHVEWLTASVSKKSLFCFYCLLFGGENIWTKNGCKDIYHLHRAISCHNSSKIHIMNAVKYKTFGFADITMQPNDANQTTVIKSNEQVKKNRYVMSKIIDCILFCGKHKLSYGHDENAISGGNSVFLDLLEQYAKTDMILDDHLSSITDINYSSVDSQNELLDSIYNVYFEELIVNVQQANFISVQVDEAINTTHLPHFMIRLRFLQGERVRERFLKFEEIRDRSAQGLTSVLRTVLEPFQVEEKLVCLAHDGATVTGERSSDVQALVHEHFPHAVFVHSYWHQLSSVVKQACCGITQCKIFFANASAFSTFFAQSSKRYDALQSVCNQTVSPLPDIRRNFQSRLIGTIYDMKQDLGKCFATILNQQWDDDTTREASVLLNTLRDSTFIFFLENFHKIFNHVDNLFDALQKHYSTSGDLSDTALTDFVQVIQKMRSDVSYDPLFDVNAPKRRREDSEANKSAMREACDIVLFQIEDRCSILDATYSLKLVDPSQFKRFERSFPLSLFDVLLKCFTFLDRKKLKSELEVLYSNTCFQKCENARELYIFLKESDLDCTFSAAIKVIEITFISPPTAFSDRGSSTLRSIKNLSRSTMGQDRLNALALLAFHEDIAYSIENFTEKVIDNFASSKTRPELLYQ